MWYQQGGSPAHSARRITEVLNNGFEDRWIGQSSNTKWPAHSPDLKPLDFYLWGTLKQQVHNELLTTREDMQVRIASAVSAISSAEIQRAVLCTATRFQACMAANGQHFEHVL